MKCKIRWTETRCKLNNENSPCCEFCYTGGIKFQRGYEGDIQEYTIGSDSSGYDEAIIIIVNKRRKIELLIDRCGRANDDFYCPCNYQEVTTFEIDGKPVEGYEG